MMRQLGFSWLVLVLWLAPVVGDAKPPEPMDLEQCIRIALENHRSLQVSAAALEQAEAQYQQALSAYWPQLNLEAGAQRADQDRSFDFIGTVQTPAMTLPIGPGGAPVPIPGQPLPMDLRVKLFDRDLARASLGLSYPIYTGGRREAMVAMAKKGVAMAREEGRKTELDVVHDVRKYYYAAQFTQQMEQLSGDTLERFRALEDLTERLYKGASLKVKKTDYLRIKSITALTKSFSQDAVFARRMAYEALGNAMGLELGRELRLAPPPPPPRFSTSLEELIQAAHRFNPDQQRLELAVAAAGDMIKGAKSGYLPTLGLEASSYRFWNGFNGGLFNEDNREGWTIGLGLRWNLFDGFATRSAVDAARANRIKLEGQRVLLDQGLALRVKNEFLRIERSRQQVEDTTAARQSTEENFRLHLRAYQEEMVETKDVIEAQVMDSLAAATLHRAQHELGTALADLEYLIGQGLEPLEGR